MSTTRHGISFERTVDAVEDLGWDPDGNEPITVPTDDDVLIEVPKGEYVFEGTGSKRGIVEDDLQNWGLRGTGDDWTDVTFRTANGTSTRFLNTGEGSDGILLEDVTFDHTDSRTGGDIGNTIKAQDNVEVRNIEHVGMSGKEPYCRWTIRPHIVDPDGVMNVVNYRKVGPSVFAGHGASDGGGGVFSGHKGTVNFIWCRIENQGGDGGLYTGKHEGQTNFYGCYFANNDMGIIRVGAGSELHNCIIKADWENAHPDNVVVDDPEPTGMSGIYMTSAQHGKSGGGIYGCDIVFESVQDDGMAVVMINNSDAPDAIENCRVQVNCDELPPIKCGDPADQRLSNHEAPNKPWSIRIEGLHLTGSGAMSGWQGDGIILSNRDGSVLRDIHVDVDTDLSPMVNPQNCADLTRESIRIGEGTAEEPTGDPQSVLGEPVPDGAFEAGLVGSPSGETTTGDNTDDNMSDDTTENGSDSGSGSDSGTDTPGGRLKLVGEGPETWYHVEVSDTVDAGERANLNDPSQDPYADKIIDDGQACVGALGGGGTDTYQITGEITAISVAGPGVIATLGGDPIDPSDFDDVAETAWPDDRSEGWTPGDDTGDGSSDEDDSSGDTGDSTGDDGGTGGSEDDTDSGSSDGSEDTGDGTGSGDGSGSDDTGDGSSDEDDSSGDTGDSTGDEDGTDGSGGDSDSGSSDDSEDSGSDGSTDEPASELQTLTIEAPDDMAGIAHYAFRATGGIYPTHSGSFTVKNEQSVAGHMQRGWTETFAYSGELDVTLFHDELTVTTEDTAPEGL